MITNTKAPTENGYKNASNDVGVINEWNLTCALLINSCPTKCGHE